MVLRKSLTVKRFTVVKKIKTLKNLRALTTGKNVQNTFKSVFCDAEM
jgi:hypothetical protein